MKSMVVKNILGGWGGGGREEMKNFSSKQEGLNLKCV